MISKIKNESRKKAEELKRASNTPAIEPLATVGLATRVAASVYHDSETGGDVYAISDTILSTEHSLSRLSIDSREDQPIVYYNIAVEAHDGEGSLEIGHVLLDGSVFTVNQTLEDGLYYTNRKRQPEFGNLQLERTTQPNISIDVLVNGIYQTTYRSDEFGRFVVEEDNISPGDTIKFRYYLSKGVWQEEEITVAGLEDAFCHVTSGAFRWSGMKVQTERVLCLWSMDLLITLPWAALSGGNMAKTWLAFRGDTYRHIGLQVISVGYPSLIGFNGV